MKYIFTLFLLMMIYSDGRAAVGCLSNSTTYTYINPEGINRNGVPSYYHRYAADQRLSTTNFCTSAVVPEQACYIYSTRDGWSSSYGTLVNYSTVDNCNLPLDDYLPLLLVSLTLVSTYFIRQKFMSV